MTAQDFPKVKFGIIIPDELPLAVDKVRYVGDEVAIVLAVEEQTAREALDLIQVDYEELPAVFDPLQAMAPDAPLVHQADGNIASRMRLSRGDVDRDFRGADYVFEDRYQTQAVYQCYLEPVTCLASYNLSGNLTVWAPVQDPFLLRLSLTQALGMAAGRIRIIQTHIGGAFGSKRLQKVFVLCAIASIKSGKPVRLTNTPTEEFTAGQPRVPMIVDLKTAVRRDGTLIAKSTRITADNGAYTGEGPGVVGAALGRLDNLYRFQSVRAEAVLVYTNKTPTGAFRGYGNPQVTFAVESQMDSIAGRLGLDPVDFRLKNVVRQGETTIHGYQLSSCGLEECLRRAAERANWKEKRLDPSSNRGLGIACSIHVSGSRAVKNYNGSTSIIQVLEDGGVSISTGEGELGQGANTALSQIAAEVLGARLDSVRVAAVDTEVSPFGYGAWASRVTYAAGNAVKLAAEEIKRELFALAAGKLEANVEDLESAGSRIYVKGSADKAVTFADLAGMALFRPGGAPIMAKASFDASAPGVDPITKYGNVSDAYAFMAQVVEVQVDPETGAVDVLNVVSAHDIGRAINPMLVEGQIEGGVAQGLGYALAETLTWQDGIQQVRNVADYHPATSVDVPPIASELVETIDPFGPFGAKAIGEPPLIPTAAAVANAIYHATGVRIKDLPFTPEKVFWKINGGDSPRIPSTKSTP